MKPNCNHKFIEVSKRGRAAYAILCLENALIHFQFKHIGWEFILKKLWTITSTNGDVGDWIDCICDLCPDEVLRFDSYELTNEYRNSINFGYVYSKEDFCLLQKAYLETDVLIEVFDKIIGNIYWIIADDWGDGEDPYTPDSLHFIDEIEEEMQCHQIPLPNDTETLAYIMNHKDKHYGKPFDGEKFSSILH